MLCQNEEKNHQGDESIESIKHVPFPEIIDNQIKTEEFLTAARDVIRIIEKFGKLFAPVKYDMQGNIDKLHTKYFLDKEKHSTLQNMILLEKQAGETIIATDALLWLRRALHMISLFFEKIVHDYKAGKCTEDLAAFLSKSYKESLEPFHGWMARQLFGLLSRMVPSRTELIKGLANGRANKDDIVLGDMDLYLVNVRKNIECLQEFYASNDLENFDTV